MFIPEIVDRLAVGGLRDAPAVGVVAIRDLRAVGQGLVDFRRNDGELMLDWLRYVQLNRKEAAVDGLPHHFQGGL